jgi:hypothetical protein
MCGAGYLRRRRSTASETHGAYAAMPAAYSVLGHPGSTVEVNLLPTQCHTQKNKDHDRRPVTRRRERMKERERDSKREGRKRRAGGRGSAEAGRAGGQAEMKSEKESPILRICLKKIGPAEDTLSDRVISSNQDLMYRLTMKWSATGLESLKGVTRQITRGEPCRP